jgi:hypothetical protein
MEIINIDEPVIIKLKDTDEKKVFNNIDYQKEYYQKNKDKLLTKLKEKTVCVCGGSYSYVTKNRHYNSGKHKKYVANNS